MREKETFRSHLSVIRELFGDAELLSLSKVEKYLGINHRTLMRDETFPKHRVGKVWKVSAINLARWLSR